MSPLYIAICVVLLEALSFGAVFPVISYYCQELGGGPVAVGLMFALVSGPRIITNTFFGWLSDHLGRKYTLAICTLGTLAGSIGWALATNIYFLGVARLVTGVFGAQAPLAQAIAADVSTPQKRAAAVGMLGAAFGIALTIGPALGGYIGHQLSHAAVGWLAATLQLTSLTLILFVLPETRPKRPQPPHHLPADIDPTTLETPAPEPQPATNPYPATAIPWLLAVTFIFTIAAAHMIAGYPLATQHVYQFSESQTGYALAVFGLVAALVQGGIVRIAVPAFGERRCFLIALAIGALGYLVLATAPPLPGWWTGTVLAAVGTALATPSLHGMLSRSTSSHTQGRILGLNQGITSLARATGTSLAGFLFARWSVAATFTSAATWLVLAAALFLWHRLSARRQRPTIPPSTRP